MAEIKATLTGTMSVPLSLVGKAELVRLKKSLTLSYLPMGADKVIEAPQFEIDDKHIHMPRQFGMQWCKRNGVYFDDQTSPGTRVKFPKTLKPRDYQVGPLKEVQEACGDYYDFIFRARTGWGKCQAKGTPILMFDGTIKKVENVKVGDRLMGPDSTPRTVLSLARGREEMFTVTPKKGQTHIFNRSHVLSLKATCDEGAVRKGEVVNVPIDEYLTWGGKRKHLFKLWRTGVEFQESGEELLYDPYIVGVYLGDGKKAGGVALTIGDDRPEVVRAVEAFANNHGVRVRIQAEKGDCATYCLPCGKGDMQDFFMSELCVAGERRIPHRYLTAGREDRLLLLAGLLDTDGHLYSGVYDLVCKDAKFADQITFLARSLGLAAYVSLCEKRAQGWDAPRTYYRVKISGNTHDVPCLVPRRQAPRRAQKKDALVTGFTVESAGEGDYYGFTLDGDHLYMLGDFTVTHNTAGSLIIAQRIGVTTLILVDQENLKQQWIDTLVKLFGFKHEDIGIIQGKKCSYEGKAVTVAMVQTLRSKEADDPLFRSFGLLIVDEVHVIGAPTFSSVLPKIAASYRVGVSATPKRKDGLQKVLDYHLGKVRVYVDDEHEESSVHVLEHGSVYSWFANTSPKIGRFLTEVAEDGSRNLLIAEAACHLYETGRDVIVLSDRIEQLRGLMDLCYYLGVPEEDMGLISGTTPAYGYEKDSTPAKRPVGYQRGVEYTPIVLKPISKRVKQEHVDRAQRSAKLLFATYGKCAKGFDLPRLSAGVDATPRSESEQVQGRILRRAEGKKRPIWVTVSDINSYRSMYSLSSRINGYVKNNAVIYVGGLLEGGKECNAKSLQSSARDRVAELKSMRIIAAEDGSGHRLETTQERMRSITLAAKRGGRSLVMEGSTKLVALGKSSRLTTRTRGTPET